MCVVWGAVQIIRLIIVAFPPKDVIFYVSGMFSPSFEWQSQGQQSKSDHPALNFFKLMLMNYQCHSQLFVALWVQNTAHTTSSSQWESREKRLSAWGPHCAFKPQPWVLTALREASSQASQGKAWLWLFDFSVLRVPGWGCCRFPGSWHSETLSSKTEMSGRERAMLIWWQTQRQHQVTAWVPAPATHSLPAFLFLMTPHSMPPGPKELTCRPNSVKTKCDIGINFYEETNQPLFGLGGTFHRNLQRLPRSSLLFSDHFLTLKCWDSKSF